MNQYGTRTRDDDDKTEQNKTNDKFIIIIIKQRIF